MRYMLKTSRLFVSLAGIVLGLASGCVSPPTRTTYVFLPDQSHVLQRGGFAGINSTYAIEGSFVLFRDGRRVSFECVDARLVASSPFLSTTDLEAIFGLTELRGRRSGETLHFRGEAPNARKVEIDGTFLPTDHAIQLSGRAIPLLGWDSFFFGLQAVARPMADESLDASGSP